MLLQLRLTGRTFVDVDAAVVRANGKESAARTVLHDFNPSLRNIYSFPVIFDVESHFSVIASCRNDAILAGKCARALGSTKFGLSGSTVLFVVTFFAVSQLVTLLLATVSSIPDDDLVVISRRADAWIISYVQTPGLAIVVRVHQLFA